jgi:exonuclease V
MDDGVLDMYVRDGMGWWRGESVALGVNVEEAYKCRMCEYAEGCTWRVERVERVTGRARVGWATQVG